MQELHAPSSRTPEVAEQGEPPPRLPRCRADHHGSQHGGSITLLSGVSAVKPPEGFSILAATNAGVVSLGKVLGVELAPIRVNVVMPGVVDTPRHGDNRGSMRAWAESLPARHFGQPEDIAHSIVFLMTNPYVTGHTLIIDGGLTLT